jgi:hypothetical protein
MYVYTYKLSVYTYKLSVYTYNKQNKKVQLPEKRKTYQRQVHLRVTAYKLGLVL